MQLRRLLCCLLIAVVLASIPHAIVKGQSTTSTISGTVRCGTGCDAVDLPDGSPIDADFRIVAVMTIALDPNTGSPNPDLPTTNADTSFDASALGQYKLQGLLPGIYDLYAYANGYQTTLFAQGVEVHEGQNLSYDAYVKPCSSSGCLTPSNTTAETTTISPSNITQQPALVLVVIAVVVVIGSMYLFSRRKEQPKVVKAKKKIAKAKVPKKAFQPLSNLKAILVVIGTITTLFALVHAGQSFAQLYYTPLLSYSVTRETSSVIPLDSIMFLTYVITIRNDQFRNSNEITVVVSTDGNLTDQYQFSSSSQLFFWQDYSQLHDCDLNGSAGASCFYAGSGFIMQIPSVPALTRFSFAFNATMPNPSVMFTYNGLVQVPSNVSVASDNVLVPEYSSVYQAEVTGTQTVFCLYSAILVGVPIAVAVGGLWAIRKYQRATA
jgi:hypothetical protein